MKQIYHDKAILKARELTNKFAGHCWATPTITLEHAGASSWVISFSGRMGRGEGFIKQEEIRVLDSPGVLPAIKEYWAKMHQPFTDITVREQVLFPVL